MTVALDMYTCRHTQMLMLWWTELSMSTLTSLHHMQQAVMHCVLTHVLV